MKTIRRKWGEFVWHPKVSQWDLSLKFTDAYNAEKDMIIVSFLLFTVYVHVPTRWCKGVFGDGLTYGFYCYPRLSKMEAFVLTWAKKTKHIEMPWTFKWFSTAVLDHSFTTKYYEDVNTNKLGTFSERYEARQVIEQAASQLYDYVYFTKSGEIQERIATVWVVRMKWSLRCWPWYKKTRTSIDVQFDEGVGEGSNSYKGGCTGCGYDLLPNESVEQCLRRMEQDRNFE